MKKKNSKAMFSALIYPLSTICFPKVLDNLKIHRAQVQHINDDDHDCIKTSGLLYFYHCNQCYVMFAIQGWSYWVFIQFSIIYQQLYHGGHVQWWWKLKYPMKTTNLSQTTGRLFHIQLFALCGHSSLWVPIELTNWQ